jgi:hypothetical protein
MVRSKLARKTINARINRVRRLFKWAASMGMVSGGVYHDLKTLDRLQEGRSSVREAPEVRPPDLRQAGRSDADIHAQTDRRRCEFNSTPAAGWERSSRCVDAN